MIELLVMISKLVVSVGLTNGTTLDHANWLVHSGRSMFAHVVPLPVPAGLVGPVAPASPLSPLPHFKPVAPLAPVAPVSSLSPLSSFKPVAPVALVAPGSPL